MIAWTSALVVANLADAEIADRLGASHILRGSLRHAGNRLRISVGLVTSEAGAQVWTERFDVLVEELFEVQDELVARIRATLAAHLEEGAVKACLRKPADLLAAYELTLRGLAGLRRGTFEADEAARALFHRALEIDPHYARAHAGMSLSYFNEWSCQYWNLFRENGRLAYAHAHRALDLDDRDAMVHVVVGRIQLYRREFEQASWYFDRALALCPNDAELLVQLSAAEVFMGRPAMALAHIERAMRLNPFHPNIYHCYAAFAYFGLRDFESAFAALDRVVHVPFVDIPAYTAIALAHRGRMAEAHEHLQRYATGFRELITFGREPEPGEPIRWLLDVNPYRRQEDVDFLLQGFQSLVATGVGLAEMVEPQLVTPSREQAPRFARAGDGWVVEFAGGRIVLPELKGLVDIYRLLQCPGEEIHCLDLAEGVLDAHGGDHVLDDKARETLKARIRDLQEEIAEAEDHNDWGRTEPLRAEFDQLVDALSSAMGLGGRSRRLGSLAERARTSVTWRIRHAVKRVEAVHPALGRHFRNSLRTGTFCSYNPEREVPWALCAERAHAAGQRA